MTVIITSEFLKSNSLFIEKIIRYISIRGE